jgi:hypothetical protein
VAGEERRTHLLKIMGCVSKNECAQRRWKPATNH